MPVAQPVSHPAKTDVTLTFEHLADTITGWSDLRFRLLDSAGGVLAEKTVGAGITIADSHHFSVDLTDGTSYNLTAGAGRQWTVRRTTAASRGPLAYGPWTVDDVPD